MKPWLLIVTVLALLAGCDSGVPQRSGGTNEGSAAQSAAGGSANEGKAARSAAGGK
jgi:hypothetical protein